MEMSIILILVEKPPSPEFLNNELVYHMIGSTIIKLLGLSCFLRMKNRIEVN